MNVNAIVHVPLTGIAALQVGAEKPNSLAFTPPSPTLVMCRVAVPVFCTVTFIAVLVPCVVVPKSGLLGVTATAAAGVAVAFPFTLTAWGESGASSVRVTLAVRNPPASGFKVTGMVQKGATEIGQLTAGM